MFESESDSFQIKSTQLELLLGHRKNHTCVVESCSTLTGATSLSKPVELLSDHPLTRQQFKAFRHVCTSNVMQRVTKLQSSQTFSTVPLTWMGSNVLRSHQVSIQQNPLLWNRRAALWMWHRLLCSCQVRPKSWRHFLKDSSPLLTRRLAD